MADRITVIRRGAVVGSTIPAEADREKLATMMVGREVSLDVDKKPVEIGEIVIQVENLVVADERHQIIVDGVTFDVHASEIVGIAGVQGNGQTELVKAITGLSEPVSGRITLLGEDISRANPRRITELGTAHIPEDRQKDGLVLPFPVSDNLILNTYYLPPAAKGVLMQDDFIIDNANQLVKEFDIRTPSIYTSVGSLSGGNQQKVIVARELSRPIRLLIAAQPTRGLDVGSIEYIHNEIIQRRDEGCGVLLVSSELDEIMELSDRIAVMYRGKIVALLQADEVTKDYVGLLMAGIAPDKIEKPTVVGRVEKTL